MKGKSSTTNKIYSSTSLNLTYFLMNFDEIRRSEVFNSKMYCPAGNEDKSTGDLDWLTDFETTNLPFKVKIEISKF